MYTIYTIYCNERASPSTLLKRINLLHTILLNCYDVTQYTQCSHAPFVHCKLLAWLAEF